MSAHGDKQKGLIMTMENAAFYTMGIILVFAFSVLFLSLWSTRHHKRQDKDVTHSH